MSIIVGATGKRYPPAEEQRALQEAFPECGYEWLPRAERWRVVRNVPWTEAARLIDSGQLTMEDVEAFLESRYMEGHLDPGDGIMVHAFTIQGPNGEYSEPGSHVVEALKKADLHTDNRSARQIVQEHIKRTSEHEVSVFKAQTEAVEEAYELLDHRFRQLPRMHYPENPISQKDAQN